MAELETWGTKTAGVDGERGVGGSNLSRRNRSRWADGRKERSPGGGSLFALAPFVFWQLLQSQGIETHSSLPGVSDRPSVSSGLQG
jgi:hypothetical protein